MQIAESLNSMRDLGHNCTFQPKESVFYACTVHVFPPCTSCEGCFAYLRIPKDTSPAVKISGPDCHPCSKHCVFVCQRLNPSQPSHLHILPLRPHPTPRIQLHFVRSDCAASTKRAASVHLDTQRTPVTAVMSPGQGVLHYSESSASLFKKVLKAIWTPRR